MEEPCIHPSNAWKHPAWPHTMLSIRHCTAVAPRNVSFTAYPFPVIKTLRDGHSHFNFLVYFATPVVSFFVVLSCFVLSLWPLQSAVAPTLSHISYFQTWCPSVCFISHIFPSILCLEQQTVPSVTAQHPRSTPLAPVVVMVNSISHTPLTHRHQA